MEVDIITPELEVNIEPHDSGTFVNIIDIMKGKIIYSKITPYSVIEIKDRLVDKMKEVLG